MQEFALVSFFAQATQPMFTHEVVERISDLVLVRAIVTEWTMSFPKCLAKGPVGIQPKAMFPFEKFREAKLICWRWLLGMSNMFSICKRGCYIALDGNAHS